MAETTETLMFKHVSSVDKSSTLVEQRVSLLNIQAMNNEYEDIA